jgi:hypothetical protein
MSRGPTRAWLAAALGGLLALPLAGAAPALATADDAPRTAARPDGPGAPPLRDPDDLRELLTERIDERQPAEPVHVDVAGRPLSLVGEYEMELAFDEDLELGDGGAEDDRVGMDQDLQLEVYYSPTDDVALFFEGELSWEKELHDHVGSKDSDSFVQRGETWLYLARAAGSPIDVELGRVNFEDWRRWWWDEELDALRVSHRGETFFATLAVAQELLPTRSDRDFVDPEHEDVLRLVGESSWRWRPDHRIGLFALHQDDHSATERPGELVRSEREDESDATLTWVGLRAQGEWGLGAPGRLAYWLDGAAVRGRDREVAYAEPSHGRSRVVDVSRRDVRGFAFDGGVTWTLPIALSPRLTLGYAVGSGGPGEGTDRSFRQTGIHDNEAGFGGVRRFSQYGEALDPELSNLQVVSAAVGVSLLRSSSVDLVYHHYRQVEASAQLRNARIEGELDGERRDVGHAVDLVLALEEWRHVEIDLIGSVFRSGAAWRDQRAAWTHRLAAAVRVNF